jgi:HEAT repeat protein
MNELRKSQDSARQAKIAELRQSLAPLIDDLRRAGYKIDSLDELRRSGKRYESAIPILLQWMRHLSSPDAKEGIVRALSVPWAKPTAGPVLVEEFKETPREAEALRWAIGNALEVVVTPSLLDGIADIVSRKENGTARQMAVLSLAKIRHPRSIAVLIDLLNDDQVAGHAIMALRKLKALEALDHLERFVDHPQAWIRNEAKKAIAAIMKYNPPKVGLGH